MNPQLTLELAHDAQQRRVEDARRHRTPGTPEPVEERTAVAPAGAALRMGLGRRLVARLVPARRPA